MIAGYTKFAPDQIFARIARTLHSLDVFNGEELKAVISRHATIIMDSRQIVQCWHKIVGEKYSSLPGIRELHDILALHNPGHRAVMKVREMCCTGTLVDTYEDN